MENRDEKSTKPQARLRAADGTIDFMSMRFYFIGFSALLTVISAVALYAPGPKLGTDFVGGTEVEVAFAKPVEASKVRSTVASLGFHDPEVVGVSSGALANRYMVRVKEVSAFGVEQQRGLEKALCLEVEGEEAQLDATTCPEELRTTEVTFSPGGEKIGVRYKMPVCASKGEADAATKGCDAKAAIVGQLAQSRLSSLGLALQGIELQSGRTNPVVQSVRDNKVEFHFKSKGDQIMDGLRQQLGADVVPDKALRIEWVGPKAGKQLRDAAITSLTLAMIFIMIFIGFRFDFRFAPGAVMAIFHDIFIALGVMIVAQREVTLSTVAALLTVLGYSINDTVVVYDRIRENLGKHRKMSFPRLINLSITETLGRTIKTAFTTALALVPFLFFGTGTIRDFAFAMLVGIGVGTYSSIFVAAPLTEYLDRRFFAKLSGPRAKKRRVVRRSSGGSLPSSSEGASSRA